MSLFSEIQEIELAEGQVAVAWLGQSGYLLKLNAGKYVVIDPYLTNVCGEKYGIMFTRLMASPITPQELDALTLSAYLITHHHEDHYDPYAIDMLLDDSYAFYTTPTTTACMTEMGVRADRCRIVNSGSTYQLSDFTIHAVFADHGELAPDAVGFVIEAAGKVIYHMGDTCFREQEFMELGSRFSIDLLIPPINGKYGNMNEAEALRVVELLHPKYVSPSHFWMLPANSGGDVLYFMEEASRRTPDSKVLLGQPGAIWTI